MVRVSRDEAVAKARTPRGRMTGAQRREQLIGIGRKLFANRGYEATTVEEVIAEISVTRMTERGATRGDDKVSDAAMEDRKKEGYF